MGFKLDETSLKKTPREVFILQEKLGEGSYGCVFKAVHRASRHVVAIKQLQVDNDLPTILKEIAIMQELSNENIVTYYGSYFYDDMLWIVMEYMGGGSVGDVMDLRNSVLSEDQIRLILRDTLLALAYLHGRNKIHRDIKAGNILLTTDGRSKLADFGVSGQITEEITKRNTLIGTPYWMAPEVIQEIGHDYPADIWSLGITAMEMAQGRPPHADLHPMRAMFMIPLKHAPTLEQPYKFSVDLNDFIAKCCKKNPLERLTAKELLKHPFVAYKNNRHVLEDIIKESLAILGTPVNHETTNQNTEETSEKENSYENQQQDSNNSMDTVVITKENHENPLQSLESVDKLSTNTVIVDQPRNTILDHMKDRPHSVNLPVKINENGKISGDRQYKSQAERRNMSYVELKSLSYQELKLRFDDLEPRMKSEVNDIKKKYALIRQPFVEAIAARQPLNIEVDESRSVVPVY